MNGLFGIAALFIIAPEVMHKMNGVVDGQPDSNTGDHHGK